jgi:hypothetical protein
LIVVVVGYFAVFGVRTTRIEAIRRQVNQGVAVGSSLNDVVHSLDAMHIERSEPERAQMTFGGHHHYGNVRLSWRSAGIRGGRCLSGKTWNSFLFSMSLAN